MRLTTAQLKQIIQEELRSVLKEGWFGSYRSPRQKAILAKLNKLLSGEEDEKGEEGAIDKGHDIHTFKGVGIRGYHPAEDAYPSWRVRSDGYPAGYVADELPDEDAAGSDEYAEWEGKPGERPRAAPEEKIIAEEMGVENINQFQELIDILGDEAFEALAGKIDKFREGNAEARLEMRDDKIRVSVFMPDPDDPDDMEWNGSEDFDKTPKGLIQALEYAKKRLFDSDPIWYGIEQVVRRYDQPHKKRQVEYFIQKNYHGETNQYWTVQAGDGDDEGFSVWVIEGGEKFEIRDIGGNAVMETNSPKDVPGMVNRYMSQSFGKLENKESLNQIIDEEIAAVFSEAEVYVPPGYEPEEDDDFDAEMAEFFANDPDALAKLKDLMGGNKAGMSLGDYLEVNPEAKEAVFGIMSGEHSDVDWESIRRNIPFGRGRLRGDVDLSELEKWIAMMLKLVIKYPIDQAELYGDSERMDLEVKNLVVRGTEDQETAAMIWDEIEDLVDYYIFPILEKFRISYKEPKDIKLIKKLETYKKALHRISQWSAVQGDMYDDFKRSYEKKFAKPPAEPVGEKLPLKEGGDMEAWGSIKKLFDSADSEEDYEHALHLADMYKENFPLTGENKRFMDEIFFNAILEVPMEHWDVGDRIEKVWGKSLRQYLKEKDPSWDGN